MMEGKGRILFFDARDKELIEKQIREIEKRMEGERGWGWKDLGTFLLFFCGAWAVFLVFVWSVAKVVALGWK